MKFEANAIERAANVPSTADELSACPYNKMPGRLKSSRAQAARSSRSGGTAAAIPPCRRS